MKILIICVGKKHDALLSPAIEHYEGSLKHFVRVEWQIIPSSDIGSESSSICDKLKPNDKVVLLDEDGKSVDNAGLAQVIEQTQNNAVDRLVLIIGGAYGVNDDVKSRADYIFSLSKLVFPHQLVRLILVEQLYRSYSILSGSKYHHD